MKKYLIQTQDLGSFTYVLHLVRGFYLAVKAAGTHVKFEIESEEHGPDFACFFSCNHLNTVSTLKTELSNFPGVEFHEEIISESLKLRLYRKS